MGLLILLAAAVLLYGAWKAISFVVRPMFSPLRSLPGPKNRNLLFGNLNEIMKAEGSEIFDKWVKEYGNILVYKAFFNTDRIFILDTRALNHVVTHSMDYEKPDMARFNLSRLLGDGILITEGDKHKQQRKVMNPSFGPSSIRALTSVFLQKSIQLRDILLSEISEKNEPHRMNILPWLSRTTLDVIGLAGFNYRFDALNQDANPNELNKAFATLFGAEQKFSILELLQAFFPIFRSIPSKRGRTEDRAKATMLRIGEQLVRERKQAVLGEKTNDSVDGEVNGQDLLSALIQANMDTELPVNQRMSDADVLAQIPTFLVAGHETTSTETMWCLYALAQFPDIQRKLREELLSVPTEAPSMDDLSALPYLDMVVRETLRVYPAVTATTRVATKDDVIPLNEPFVDRYGQKQHSIKISKGDFIFIPILSVHRSKAIWGEDALDFNPDRWSNIPEAAKNVPSVMGGLLTFLSGARGCIGYRFALTEMKALLFTLVRALEFDLAVPVSDIGQRSFIVLRPFLRSEKDKNAQMPLIVRPYRARA